MYSHRVFTKATNCCLCVCTRVHGYGSGAVAIATRGTGNIQNHFRAMFSTRVAHAHTRSASYPTGSCTHRPGLSARPCTWGAGRGGAPGALLWHTATVVHGMHASMSPRLSMPRHAVGVPEHQEGRYNCSSSQVLDAHPPCFTRTRCTFHNAHWRSGSHGIHGPSPMIMMLLTFFFEMFMFATSRGSRRPL